MTTRHKNKTLAAMFAFLLGALGLHRFYMTGPSDRWGWLHLASLPATIALLLALPGLPLLVTASPLVLSALVASVETFVIGLMPDEQWDARWNAGSGEQSDSRWPVAALMVANLFFGATLLLTVIARAFDLVLTGGAYG
jgi:TM2 domain-containing membrane protein YozV